MDFELERRQALPMLRRLRRELAARGCGVAILDSRPCLAVASHCPQAPLSVLVDATRTHFAGKLTFTKTLGGHRRYRQTEIHALLTYATRSG